MNPSGQPLIRNISDTARWAALYRARETDRPDALFRDPFAKKLAGERGAQIAEKLRGSMDTSWAWTMRTYLCDELILQQIGAGVDTVVNIAAGLDARPYRMNLPSTLKWVEIDLPGILDYKEEILAKEKPVCALEHVRLDLSHVAARRELFARLGRNAKRVLVLTEGLLIYLSTEEVASLAQDLAANPTFRDWLLDICSPGLLKMMKKEVGSHVEQAGAPFKFGPAEGPPFFVPYGWKPADVRSLLKWAGKFHRLTFWMALASKLPSSNGRQGSRPWSAVCLMQRA